MPVFVEAFDAENEPVGIKQFFITPDATQCPKPVPAECVIGVTDLGVQNLKQIVEDILLADAAIEITISGCAFDSVELERRLRSGEDTIRFADSPHKEVAPFGCGFRNIWQLNGPSTVGEYTIRVLDAANNVLPGGSATYQTNIEDSDCEAAGATLP